MNNFTFNYGGHRQDYIVTFEIIENAHVIATCSCSSGKPCKHIQNLLIGRVEKIPADQMSMLRAFISRASKLEEGKKLINKAKAYFQQETSCRRCNSVNIVDTKQKNLSARLYKLISSHRYYCKDCRWSW